ncbi:MAG TPA: hypothetical protein VLM83_12740 [Anaerolineales bacterium]|nr:hypothetical protein [Anaerolineales bacterium]
MSRCWVWRLAVVVFSVYRPVSGQLLPCRAGEAAGLVALFLAALVLLAEFPDGQHRVSPAGGA